MTTVVFIQGGGVREARFAITCQFLQQMFQHHGITHKLAFCFWGDEYGSRPPDLCMPDTKTIKKKPKSLTLEQKVARWDLLYRDPLAELRVLRTRPIPEARPSQGQGQDIWARIQTYHPSQRSRDFLEKWQLMAYWERAWRYIINDNETAKEALVPSGADFGEPAECIGRALVAQVTVLALADSVQSLYGPPG